MFEVNLLAATGLQELALKPGEPGTTVHEAAIIDRLAARLSAESPEAVAPAVVPAARGRRWWALVVVGLLAAAAFWLYREGRLDSLRRDLAAWLGRPIEVAPPPRAPQPMASSAVMG